MQQSLSNRRMMIRRASIRMINSAVAITADAIQARSEFPNKSHCSSIDIENDPSIHTGQTITALYHIGDVGDVKTGQSYSPAEGHLRTAELRARSASVRVQ